MPLEQGTILLIPVPFTDLSATKRRPVIVISSTTYHQQTTDMIVVAMTSNPTVTPYTCIITNEDLQEGHLNRPGTIRGDKIYTLSQALAVRVFGKVHTDTMKLIKTLVESATQIEL
jgi:mRNA interferase MazF